MTSTHEVDRHLLPDLAKLVRRFLMPYKTGDLVMVLDCIDMWWIARVRSELVSELLFDFLGHNTPRHGWHLRADDGRYYDERLPDRLLDIQDFTRSFCTCCDPLQFCWTNGFIFSTYKCGDYFHKHDYSTEHIRALIATDKHAWLCNDSWQSKCTCCCS